MLASSTTKGGQPGGDGAPVHCAASHLLRMGRLYRFDCFPFLSFCHAWGEWGHLASLHIGQQPCLLAVMLLLPRASPSRPSRLLARVGALGAHPDIRHRHPVPSWCRWEGPGRALALSACDVVRHLNLELLSLEGPCPFEQGCDLAKPALPPQQ